MSRYIDADLIEWYGCDHEGIYCRTYNGNCTVCPLANCYAEQVRNIPTVEVKPIVRGEWELVDDTFDEMKDYKCNLCGQLCAMSIYKMMNFCPNCGADMRTEREEEE